MLLSDILEQAKSGEVSGMSSKQMTDQKLVSFVNLSLVAIYKRFPLRLEEALITLKSNKTLYSLDGSDLDVVMPTGTEVYAIDEAFDELGGISVNDDNDDLGIFTYGISKIQVPAPIDGAMISVIYRAGPDRVVFVDDGNGGAVDTDVPIPSSLIECVLAYMGYRAHMPTGANVQEESNKHYIAFKNACDEAENFGMTPSDEWSMDVSKRGWV